ncbi:MAG: hypothetical protein HRU41_20735 [Saprospiraceae bacterium]|nr:hypothetical protein [Saprospiraceae bacterium]
MKKIKFEEWGSLGSAWLLLVAMVLIPVGYLLIDSDRNVVSTIGFIVLALHFARPFFYLNYVRWNARKLIIKRGMFTFDSVRFADIISVNYDMERLRISSAKGKQIEWNLKDFELEDIAQLLRILGRNTSSLARS